MEKFTKQPYEEFVISADFVNVVTAEDEIISAATVSATDNTGTDASEDVLDDESVDISGTQVQVKVLAGDIDKSPYKVTFRCTTSTGNKWEMEVTMNVREN